MASSLALLRFLLFLRFRRTFFAPSAPSVTAPGQILFPVEFKTLRNTRIYFTGVPRRREGKRRGFTPDPTRLVNVTKKRCILGRRGEREEEKATCKKGEKGREGGKKEGRRREGSSKLLYLRPHRYSRDDPGAIIFPKLRPSTISKPIFFFFLLFIPLPPSPLSLSLFTHCRLLR